MHNFDIIYLSETYLNFDIQHCNSYTDISLVGKIATVQKLK